MKLEEGESGFEDETNEDAQDLSQNDDTSSDSSSRSSMTSQEDEISDSEKETERSGKHRSDHGAEARDGDGKNFFKVAENVAKASKWKATKKSQATASKLEDQMNFEHLKKLEEIFQEADADGGGGLDIDEFREAMKRTMGSEVDDKELEIIFMKVDTNCDGTVDWDEYLSYMLLEYQEKDTMTSLIKEVPFPKKLKDLQSYHRDCVVRISFLQHLANRHGNKALDRDNPGGKFISLSKEGQLGMYGMDFELVKSVAVDSGRESYVGQWLTDMAPLANVSMLAISSTEREITFYDVGANKFEKQYQVTGFRDPILSMDFWFDHEDLNHCNLVAGDATGSVIVLKFDEALMKGLFAVYPQKGVLNKISFLELMRHQIRGVYGMIFQEIHTNWINSVKYFSLAQGSECFISCSATDNDSMFLGDLTNITYKPKWPGYTKDFSNKSSYFKVRKGILAFDYCKDWNVIVTGSYDGVVRTWNPFSSKPTSMIKGHKTPVQHVMIISSSGQVITGGRDRTIRILELRDHMTTQVLGPRTFLRCGPLTHPIQAIYYHGRTKSLWVAAMQVGVLEGFDERVVEDQMNIKSHDGAVTAVLYNKLFNQVVTGGHDSIVSVWDLNTGVKAIQFYTVKGVELTSMTFDPTGRRLITGSRNGSVRIWNFNNGACLRTLEEETMLEVTGVVCMKQKIITAGWNKIPTVYIDSRGDDDEDESHQWAKVHSDDILCLASFQNVHGTAIVASASYDGDIFIWSVDTGHVLCRLNKQEAYSPLSIEGYKMKPTVKIKSAEIRLRKSFSALSTTSQDSLADFNQATGRRISIQGSKIKLPAIAGSNNNMTGGNTNSRYTEESAKQDTEINSLEPSRTSTPKSVSFAIPEIPMPSARYSTKPKISKQDKIRHHVDIVTGQNDRDYWKADVSIDKLIFLQSRPHEPQTASLFAAGALGWVYAWSVHPQGGLLGQFVGAHCDGDTVFSMATDEMNKFLITGDTSGYVKMWDIDNYCCRKRKNSRHKQAPGNLASHNFKMEEDEMRILSVRRMMKLNIVPPELAFYFRAHIGSVTDMTYINNKNLLLTACGDGTVRLWTIAGIYVGTFGQKQPWQIEKKQAVVKMPADVKRVASANTLKVFNIGHSPWRLARNILNFVTIGGKKHEQQQVEEDDEDHTEMYKKLVGESSEVSLEEIEKNYQKSVKKMEKSEVLGKSYKRKQRHRILPKIDVKTHLCNFHVHSSIPFSPLEDTEVIPVPELLQEKWRMQRGTSECDKLRPMKAALKVTRNIKMSSRKKHGRSQVTFASASNKIAKAVKLLRPSR